MAVKIDCGTKFRPGNREALTALLEGWIKATAKYSKASGDSEAGYFWGERASISILAAGAWLADGVALEEYQTEKTRAGIGQNGRADLYVHIGPSRIGIEAKHRWTSASWSDDVLQKHLQACLAEAVSDAKELGNEVRRYGCVFVVPRFKKDVASGKEWQATIEAERERIIRLAGPVDAWAWCFPPEAATLEFDDLIYPGALVAIQSAEK